MNIIFMGSARFSIAPLAALVQSEHKIALVVTQPDKPAGRGQKIAPCPAAEWAKEHNLALLQPPKLKNNPQLFEQFKRLEPDVIVVVAYGKILPKEILNLPQKGCINLHASLLPKYRGAAPINWAVINGEKETGVTTMYMNEKMDEGDILLQCATAIQEHDTSETLYEHLGILGAELLLKTLNRVEKGLIKGLPQDGDKATYAPILKKEDGLINWSLGAHKIYDRIRGLLPWPKAYTHIKEKQFTIFDAAVIDIKPKSAPGTIISMDGGIIVATGDGQLCLLEVQIEGKKRIPAIEFVKGSGLNIGDRLG